MTPRPDRDALRKRSRLTVQNWLYSVLAIMGLVVFGGALTAAFMVQRTNEISDVLIHTIQPSRIGTLQLQAALVDQETAIRGYAITADADFLAPYEAGRKIERERVEELRDLLASYPDLSAGMSEIESAADDWRTRSAEPLLASVTRGAPKLIDAETAERGRIQFDSLRVVIDQQNARLTAERDDLLTALDDSRDLRDGVLAATVAVFFLTALILGVLVRTYVTGPLARLAASCRRTAEGEFSEPIPAEGPKDIFEIGVDAEAMRERLVGALAASQDAHQTVVRQARILDAQAGELRRSNAELEQFAFTASHDLQEPLRKVASFCQLLEKRYGDRLDDRAKQYIDFAVDGATRMQILINDLLSFSRVGRQSGAHTTVALDDAIDSALRNLQSAIGDSAASIVREHRPLPQVTGDATLLTMLFQNLIGNAIKFRHPESTPRIVIDCVRGPDGTPVLSVADNGIGIAQEFSEKVFVIFQRLHNRETYSGTGIGLAMCKKIVEHHGGRIWIDDQYTEGTRFDFTLPGAQFSHAEILEGLTS